MLQLLSYGPFPQALQVRRIYLYFSKQVPRERPSTSLLCPYHHPQYPLPYLPISPVLPSIYLLVPTQSLCPTSSTEKAEGQQGKSGIRGGYFCPRPLCDAREEPSPTCHAGRRLQCRHPMVSPGQRCSYRQQRTGIRCLIVTPTSYNWALGFICSRPKFQPGHANTQI